jgi:tetratricopeptide (TPR) repeat protein
MHHHLIRFALVCLLNTGVAAGAAAVDPNDPPEGVPPSSAIDLTEVRAKVKAKDWKGAISDLVPITERANSADAFNLLAFSQRNLGQHEAAFANYFKALELDPNHKGAREYLGELYVNTGQIDKAREQLAILERICPAGCEELDDLRKAVGAGGTGTNAR